MPGLIPLMLGNRASWLPPPPTTSPTSQTGPKLRRQSTQNTDTWQSYQAQRPKPVKRLSLPAPAPLPMVPYSPAEWKKAITEIKRHHIEKRHRACSARCVEILNGIKEKSQIEPVYLIYLHFYAATSLEICARPLPSSSQVRTDLLHQARSHFNRASALINAAEESVVSKVRSSSSVSSRGSSCHSPSSSISSRAWTPETPTESVSSCEDLSGRDSSPKRVKKVSFSLPKEEPIQIEIPEPMIRPDSPTLGFDDFYFSSPVLQQKLPEPPVSPKFQEVEYPLHTIHESEDENENELPSPSPSETSEEDDENTYMISQTVDRCCEHLSGLRKQLNRHSANLDQWLRSPQPPSLVATTRARSGSAAEELRMLDKQARIERLRKINWERRRFDPTRYEELCEEVMAELS
ncbi:hypothetical protein B0T21DRAFT_413166 [Apiosordaria backusii]|uniref:Uncharacterized protein n=1 Tax=Apiosordaria backusii TaxID=314023 RepID=A0AA40EB76_9PEZI|nr:hypothetical protein B0T21DRAFT_413166 [Apiosordaria backusii]